jgi:hypothetical protein
LTTALLAALCCVAAVAEDWKPVSPDDLQIKELAGAKGAHAAILYYEDIYNDKDSLESIYFRIKILSEEGKKYADVELPAYDSRFQVNNLKARTIRPDGSIAPFDGKFFTKVVAKRKEIKILTKTFSIPDVQVGSIIEYRYNLSWDASTIYTSQVFTLQHELFTRKAHVEVVPYERYAYSYTWFGLPDNFRPAEGREHRITIDAADLPAVEKEDFMPPENEVRARVVVFKRPESFSDTDKFWKEEGKSFRSNTEKFLDKKNAMNNEVASLVKDAKTPEEKLRRIYDRVQKIQNLTYEEEKTEKEVQHDKRKFANNVEDVLKNGYGYHNQINRLFVALARAAGFDASVVRVTERDSAFFHKAILSASQFDTDIALVKLDGKDLYLSPATPFCPFGFLPWEDTSVAGWREEKDGASFVTTSMPTASDTLMSRRANLTLSDDGTLSGDITVVFTGMEALSRRLSARQHDEVERKKNMEEEIQSWLPTAGSTAELVSVDKWDSTEPLVVKAKVRIPGYASGMGKRVLLPAFAFHTNKGHAFQKSRRVQPIYFRNTWTDNDEITIKLPEMLSVESIPNKREFKNGPVAYVNEVTKKGNELTLHRQFVMDNVYFDPQYYAGLQQVFNTVKAGDDEQVVLRFASTSAAAK